MLVILAQSLCKGGAAAITTLIASHFALLALAIVSGSGALVALFITARMLASSALQSSQALHDQQPANVLWHQVGPPTLKKLGAL